MTRATANLRRRVKFLLPASACALACLMGSAQAYRMMSWQEYRSHSDAYAACPCSFRTTSDCPCSYQIKARGGTLLYYGSQHKLFPSHPQYAEIEALWNEFHPEVAFYEGPSLPILQFTKEQAIGSIGEPGLVVFLAQHDKVRVLSIEPPFAKEVESLRKTYDAERLKMFYIVRQKLAYDRLPEKAVSLEDYLDQALNEYLRAVKAPPYSIGELESMYAKYFPNEGSYRDARSDLVDPLPAAKDTIFNEIARASSDYRDRAMVAQISRAACGGKRVFAVVGFSHVVMQQSALSELLKNCPKKGR